ncbi:hypothetical protein AGMMS49940_13130 [Spirochaetia bacterium]|nr:hypothetical protein AGMMS49940_13130 [Spirochaetia bacterium]
MFPVLLLGVWILFPLGAQEGDGGGDQLPIDTEWPDRVLDVYSRGDKMFGISLGPLFPLLFIGESGILDNKAGPVGGTLSLSYSYFLTSHLFVGGELQGMFAPTKGKNVLFIVPIGVRVGYQFILGRFEIPLAFMIGFAPQKYLEQGYIGLFMKPSASLFWRFNPDWSFGLNTEWWWVPQWPDRDRFGTSHDVYGNFLEVSLSARYHF